MEVILNRILIRMESLKQEHDVGDGKKILLAYGELEGRLAASVNQGEVVCVGPDAFTDWGYKDTKPIKPGDIVQFAKYSGAGVFDEARPSDKLAVINDEDVLIIVKSKETN